MNVHFNAYDVQAITEEFLFLRINQIIEKIRVF